MTFADGSYGALQGRRDSPSVRRMADVATALGEELCTRVVFIGASLLPLMETEEHVLSSARSTGDVDAVVATTNYSQKFAIEENLRSRGFKNVIGHGAHADRWTSPQGTILDLVACGAHMGGTGNKNDQWVVAHAARTDLPPRVKHASAVGLLLLKCSAYNDRGAHRPLGSKDLSDIATLIATRPDVVSEANAAPIELRGRIAEQLVTILGAPPAVSAIRTHIAEREPLFAGLDDLVLARMRQIADVQ
ncbi:MAG: hypothetical protein ABIT38_00150 [Gemmatimonadaceae bacterium]